MTPENKDPDPGPRPFHIMILTGEPSGDFHGAPLIRSLKKIMPGVKITGIGGTHMAEQGAEIFFPIERLSAMGLIQVARQLSTIRQAFRTVKERLETDPPDAVVLIDYPGFNLKVAQYIKTNYQIPVCYYIAPKVWAWNAARLKKIRAYTDHVALILPFELPIYKKMKIPASYVGNPLMDEYPSLPVPPSASHSSEHQTRPVIGLLPGSRSSEITTLLPVMLDAAQKIARTSADVSFLVSSGTAQHDSWIRAMVGSHPVGRLCRIVEGRPNQIFDRADMVVAASGTVTLEAALCQVPTILIYKLSSLAYALGRLLVKVKYAGLANLIVDQEVMPELLQDRANADAIFNKVSAMMADLDTHRNRLAQVRQRLGRPGAPDRTAKIIFNLVKTNQVQGFKIPI